MIIELYIMSNKLYLSDVIVFCYISAKIGELAS